MVVLEENLAFVLFLMKNFVFFLTFYFDPGIILGLFRHRKSFFVIENSKCYESLQFVFDLKIVFLINKWISLLKNMEKH